MWILQIHGKLIFVNSITEMMAYKLLWIFFYLPTNEWGKCEHTYVEFLWPF